MPASGPVAGTMPMAPLATSARPRGIRRHDPLPGVPTPQLNDLANVLRRWVESATDSCESQRTSSAKHYCPGIGLGVEKQQMRWSSRHFGSPLLAVRSRDQPKTNE